MFSRKLGEAEGVYVRSNVPTRSPREVILSPGSCRVSRDRRCRPPMFMTWTDHSRTSLAATTGCTGGVDCVGPHKSALIGRVMLYIM